MFAKVRWFVRRSIYRYFIAVVMFSFGRHLLDTTINSVDIVIEGVLGFILLCFSILLIQIVAARMQSKRIKPTKVIFKEDELTVTQFGKTTNRGWDWIISAEDTPSVFALLIQKKPIFEIYLPKSELTGNEQKTLLNWLIKHDKLSIRGKA